jgi:LuxR family transcriptional regulator, maltose regulon positive regulatory protein
LRGFANDAMLPPTWVSGRHKLHVIWRRPRVSETVLAIGLTRQPPRSSADRFVSRPALSERLAAGATGTVTLVCAPAGTGKTVLLRTWADQADEIVAWVAIERGEADAQRFWLDVINALADAAGDEIVERVSPAPGLTGAVVAERLLGQLQRLGEPLVLIIDDLHELDSKDALGWLEIVLTRLPPALRVVLATREEPALALHRLRLAGELTELREPDLRFSLDETRTLLASSAITLSDSAVASLHSRTEGWPAGLRLAAISLSTHPDPERFVAEFSGTERTVAGYLLAEVLERQPPEVRDLLLRTSILERVSGPLADVLTGETGAEAILQRLEDQNAFVAALDAGRSWFRYHRLFADLLHLELRRIAPAAIPSLHRAAAAWHEDNGDVLDAVRHYQAARDWAPAGRLSLDHYFELTMAGRGETLQTLLEAFPAEARLGDGNLAAALSIDAVLFGRLDEAADYLRVARELAPAVPADRRRLFNVYLALLEVELARRHSDVRRAQQAARGLEAALSAAPESGERPVPPDYRALMLINLGIAELWAGRAVAARQHLEEALAYARRLPRPFLEVGCLAHLAMAAPLTGQPLPLAIKLSEHALAIAEEHGWTGQSIATGAFATAAIGCMRVGRLDEAERHLARAEESWRAGGDPGTQVVVHHARGLLRFGQGRLEEALAAFTRAQDLQRLLGGEHVFIVDARARALQVRVRMGDAEAVRTALAALSPEQRERGVMRIALAALELEADKPDQAVEALAPVIDGSAPALVPRWTRVEALLLDAAARDRLGDRRATEESLEAALGLAEPEGLVLSFMVWPTRELLEHHPGHRSAHGALISMILDTLAGHTAAPPLHDELSHAEMRVVRYLPSNLTANEIAAALVVSTNTVRTHMRHIYAKLDAHTRSEAVARARELGLVAPSAVRR